jgi:murein DD-endopeptidase MepM/ murein hydrolase activator NlpD
MFISIFIINNVTSIVQITYEQSPCPSAPVFNPTNGGTYTIKYKITDPPKYVSAYIVNFDKNQIRKTFYTNLYITNSNEQTITWNGRSDSGNIVANGQYYFKIESRSTQGGSVLSTIYARVSVNGGSGGFIYNPFHWCNFHIVPGYYFDNDTTSNYKDYRGGYCSYNGHKGTDFTCPTGTNLYAGFTGYIIECIQSVPNNQYGDYGPYGNRIKILRYEDNSWEILYAHLAQNSVPILNPPYFINAGQYIAKSDNTGNSEGPHLHFEMIQNGISKDPYLYGCYFVQDPRGCSYCECGCHSSSVCP